MMIKDIYIYIYYTHIHVYCMMSNFDTKMQLEMCQPMRHGMNVYLSFFGTMYNMCVCVIVCVPVLERTSYAYICLFLCTH